jgi:hypothetical protein
MNYILRPFAPLLFYKYFKIHSYLQKTQSISITIIIRQITFTVKKLSFSSEKNKFHKEMLENLYF